MKKFRVEYYIYNKRTEIYELHVKVVDSKELAEFIIEHAYDNEVMIREVKEL